MIPDSVAVLLGLALLTALYACAYLLALSKREYERGFLDGHSDGMDKMLLAFNRRGHERDVYDWAEEGM